MIAFIELGNGSLEIVDCYLSPSSLGAIDEACDSNARDDCCRSQLYMMVGSLTFEPGCHCLWW